MVVDLTVSSHPQIVSQTGLDSISPFSPGFADLQNRAAVIPTASKIAFVGAFSFDTSEVPNNGSGID